MISLNPTISTGTKQLQNTVFNNKNVSCEVNFKANDKFIKNSKSKKADVREELMSLFEKKEALDVISEDVANMSKLKQKIINYGDGAKTVTFHKGLKFLPWSYRGELDYGKNNKLVSAVIIADKPEMYEGKMCRKNIYLNRTLGLHIVYEAKPSWVSHVEFHYNLDGKIRDCCKHDKKGNLIKEDYTDGKLSRKTVKYANNSGIDQTISEYQDGKEIRYTVCYHPDKYQAVRKRVFDENENLVQESIKGMKLKGKTINITVDYKNGEKIVTKDVIDEEKHEYSIKKGNKVLHYMFNKNTNCSGFREVLIPVYCNGTVIGEKTVPLHLIKDIL